MKIKTLLLCAMFGLAAGCARPLVMIPDDIGDQGLLIGKVSVPGVVEFTGLDPMIDGRMHVLGLRDGYIVIALSPGKYTLNALSRIAGSQTISTAVGTYYSETIQSYPLELPFTIEAGRATNIGLLVLRPSAKPNDIGKYVQIAALDNSEEMASFLRQAHPRLFASLKNPSPVLAPGRYQEPVHRFRQRHAQELAGRKPAGTAWAYYVGGAAGTLARVEKTASGSTVRILDTGTFADLSRCSTSASRLVCLKSTTEYLFVRDGVLSARRVPDGVMANSMHVFGDSGIALVDDAMQIYNSLDDGRTWAQYAGATRAKPVARGVAPEPLHSFGLHAGRSGYYLYSVGMKAADTKLVHFNYAKREFALMTLPESVEYIKVLQETEEGLFIGPSHTDFAKGKLHFLPRQGDRWTARDAPQAQCRDLAFPDQRGRRLQVLCGRDSVWKSEDSGATWSRMFITDSLFRAGGWAEAL
jgi:hypothetical protein